MSNLITVFGATGNQGGSVIRHILADAVLSKQFRIRGITRDPTKPAAQALAAKGVEMMKADLSSKSSLADALRGAHTVFLATNYWESGKSKVEITQGKNAADVAKDMDVKHLIFSSLLNVTKTTGGRLKNVPQFDGKADIEEYIREKGIPATFYLPGCFMTNFVQSIQKGEDGSYTLAIPVSNAAKFPLIDIAEDTGKFVKSIIKNREALLGARVYGAADYYTPKRMMAELEEVTGKKSNYVQITTEQFKSFVPEFMADELVENQLFIENPGYYNGEDLGQSHDILEDKLTTWKEFVAKSGAF
ncbi:NmrA family transcriptional regulator [Macrophomina phaseolina]|uniref:NmrA family transcriptional regulator n=1 Tax=Macrophomina phaseolina TaxID=35725 RepID=A0ABQ8GER2_9PEZI|nr:NmrA family transcriptional regulator [Macrophomina phaseolina]